MLRFLSRPFRFVAENRSACLAECSLMGFSPSFLLFCWEFFVLGGRWIEWRDCP